MVVGVHPNKPAGSPAPVPAAVAPAAAEDSGIMFDDGRECEKILTHVIQASCKFLDGPKHNFGIFPAPQGITTPEELSLTCTFKLVEDGSILRVISKAPELLSNKKRMLKNFKSVLAPMVTKSEDDQSALLVALNHVYQELQERLNERSGNGSWWGCQDIPLLITKADSFDIHPTLVTVGEQHGIFFSVMSMEEYTKQLLAEKKEEMKESAKKKQRVIKFE
jgi:hypothetical protein